MQMSYCLSMPEDHEPFARLTLEGARFQGGRLPIDAMRELQRFQESVVAAARKEWLEDHPDEELPEGFEVEFDLAITKIGDGSAVLDLERPVAARTDDDVLGRYWIRGRDRFEAELAETLISELNEDILELELLGEKGFRETGASLLPAERAVYYFPTDAAEVVVTPEVRQSTLIPAVKSFDKQVKKARLQRHTENGYIAGRLTQLDANKRNFTLASLHFGEVRGSYKQSELTADLKAVLNSSAKAPVVRIHADMRFLGTDLKKLLDVRDVELLEIDGKPWSRKFVELASLPPEWSGEGGGAEMISFPALDAARDVLSIIDRNDWKLPGVFPMEDGGVLIEWASSERVTNIEISPNLDFVLFQLPEGTNEAHEIETRDFGQVGQFLEEVNK